MINLKFNTLKIEGFQSIGKADINFENLGTCFIKGINNYDDKASSNGSGKSSLVLSIMWCLFGKTAAGIGNDVINKFYSENGCFVQLDLDIDNVNYIITRSIKHSEYGSSVVIIKNSEDISGNNKTDSDKLIKDILKMDSELFTQMIFLSQGFANRFAIYTPKARKELLESLYGLDIKLSELIDTLKFKEDYAADVLNSYNSSLIKYDTQRDSFLKQIEELKYHNDKFNNNISALKNSKCDINSTDLELISNKLKQIRLQKDNLNSKIAQRTIQLNEIFNNMKIIDRDIKSKTQEIVGFSNNKICPTCGTLLEDYSSNEHIQQRIKQLENDINKLQLDKDRLTKKSINEKDIVDKLNNKLTSFNNNLNELQLEFNSKNKLYEAELKKDAEINSLMTNIETNNELITEKTNQIAELDDLHKTLELSINDKNREINVLKHSIRLANNQFKSYMLESIVKLLNRKLESLSKNLFENEIVTINLNTKLDICLGLKVYEQLSGGEQRKVDVAIIIAQRFLAQQMNAVSSNILILDEIFDGLDDVSFNLVLDLLSDEMQDVESTFIISHRDIKDISFDHLITVTKDKNQISSVYIN